MRAIAIISEVIDRPLCDEPENFNSGPDRTVYEIELVSEENTHEARKQFVSEFTETQKGECFLQCEDRLIDIGGCPELKKGDLIEVDFDEHFDFWLNNRIEKELRQVA